jgi:nitroimidazol reductase NimA-like FMN-containing flavoprotein (pyridoxamine 5'-phosphate oxidase superfamily)
VKPLPEAVRSFLLAANVCRIATVREDGTPHIIPVCPVFDGDETVYVDVAKDGVTARALAGNGRLTAIFDEYYDDWSKLRAVILRCRARPAAGAELERAWELFREKYPQGQAIGWEARHTLALLPFSWTEWGLVRPLGYESE